MALLNDNDRKQALEALTSWDLEDSGLAITKTFKFKNFIEAFSFMSGAALFAEKQDHHPEWTNVWNRVEVRLTTHDAGGLTDKDIALAKAMDTLAE